MIQCQLTMLSLRLSYVTHKNVVLSLLGPGFNSISLDIIKYEEHRNFIWFYAMESSFVLT
jgi:hypothetical protein